MLTSLFAIGEKTNTMQADFVQTIKDDKNSTITYTGTMLAKRPNMTKWHYKEPIEKSVYVTASNVTIIEPELEQAIIQRLNNSIDILAILSSVTKVGKSTYEAFYNNKKYQITMKGALIQSISFADAFDNRVTITFTAQKINQKLNNDLFVADIPADFDIIRN